MAAKQVHIEAIQTVTPAKVSQPSRSRRISTTVPLAGWLLHSHHRLVAYFKTPTGEDRSVHNLVVWFKESLNSTLGEHQLFAGRLRSNEGDGKGKFEIKFSDAGLRLVQAKAEMTMSEFMEMKGRGEREGMLAYWADIDEARLQYSALCHVQVTIFEGGGYSIGVSCSVLLADPVMLVQFFKKWAQIHTTMLTENTLSEHPIFHLSRFRRPGVSSHLKSTPLDSTTPTTHTMLFNFPAAAGMPTAALVEAVKATGAAPRDRFYVIEGGREEVRVGFYEKREEVLDDDGLKIVGWDVLAVKEVVFGEGNTPVHVSYHVQSSEVVVHVLPSSVEHHGLGLIIATVPKKD